MHRCAPGQHRDQKTQECVSKTTAAKKKTPAATTTTGRCPNGSHRDKKTQDCVQHTKPHSKKKNTHEYELIKFKTALDLVGPDMEWDITTDPSTARVYTRFILPKNPPEHVMMYGYETLVDHKMHDPDSQRPLTAAEFKMRIPGMKAGDKLMSDYTTRIGSDEKDWFDWEEKITTPTVKGFLQAIARGVKKHDTSRLHYSGIDKFMHHKNGYVDGAWTYTTE